MVNFPYYYLVLCVDGFRDYVVSLKRLTPGVVREIPDSMGGLHQVLGVYPALRQNYDAHQERLAQKARRA